VTTPPLLRGLLLPDMHVPYQDRRAWRLVMQVASALQVAWVTILGDFLDCYALSSHSKDPARAARGTLLHEAAEGRRVLRELELKVPAGTLPHVGARRKFLFGNHEVRLERYVQDNAPALKGVTSIDALLQLTKHGWAVTPYKQHTRSGKLYQTHDVGKSGPGSAQHAVNVFQHNVVVGHTHHFEHVIEGNAEGVPHMGLTLGWLGDVRKVDYMHRIKARRKWVQMFGLAYVAPNGWTYVTPIPIIGYTCVAEGRLFRG